MRLFRRGFQRDEAAGSRLAPLAQMHLRLSGDDAMADDAPRRSRAFRLTALSAVGAVAIVAPLGWLAPDDAGGAGVAPVDDDFDSGTATGTGANTATATNPRTRDVTNTRTATGRFTTATRERRAVVADQVSVTHTNRTGPPSRTAPSRTDPPTATNTRTDPTTRVGRTP
jgi:hypothetical protein